MRILISIFLFFTGLSTLLSQNYTELLRYSHLRPGGTARVVGVGGAFGAMGGDYGGITINPAALGNYWVSELTATPSATISGAETSLLGGPTSDKVKANFNLSHMGIVFASSPWSENWETSSITFGYNRLANYNESFEFSGKSTGSIIGRYLEQANGFTPDELDDFEIGPAYEVGAIYEQNDQNIYQTDFNPFTTEVNKEQSVDRKGGLSEIVIGWGGNYKRKVNLGASIGIPIVRFEESKLYQERDPQDEIDVFDALTFSEFVKTTGIGIKMSVGATYVINNSFRIGAAYHTRTAFALKDSFNTVSYYAYTFDGQSEEFDSASPQGVFDYGVRTPQRTVGSVGYLFRKDRVSGFFNLDVEYANHSTGSFNLTKSDQSGPADAEYETQLNNLVQLELSNAINFRLGTELAMSKWRVRGGVAFNQSPYEEDNGNFETSIAAGLGYRGDTFFLDLAGRSSFNEFNYIPYLMDNPQEDQLVNVSGGKVEFILTGGMMF